MTDIESKVYLELSEICNVSPGEIRKLVEDYVKEDNEMKATSIQNIRNVKDICFAAAAFPMGGRGESLTIRIHTDDDIFEFNFEGPDLVQKCKKSGLFSGLEKEQKIKKLEQSDVLDKEAADYWSKEHDTLLERFRKLQEENEELRGKYNLERAANEAHHRFFHQYAGRGTEIEFNYAIDDTKEVSYVIVNKDRYRTLKDNSNRCTMINGRSYTFSQVVARVLELEEENNRLKDTAKEGDYVCLGSIPYSADDIKKLKEQIKKLEEPVDNVNHPSHYTGRYECIDVMQDVFGDEATDNFCLCNAFKYIWRARKKNGLEDVKKAVWYLNKYIEEAEKDGVSKGE